MDKHDNGNIEYEEYRKIQIKKWIVNGMPACDAEQLMYESENDRYRGDLDMDQHYDITIDERADEYGGFGLTEDDIEKYQE